MLSFVWHEVLSVIKFMLSRTKNAELTFFYVTAVISLGGIQKTIVCSLSVQKFQVLLHPILPPLIQLRLGTLPWEAQVDQVQVKLKSSLRYERYTVVN
jgi:hypothetical protein